MRPHYRGMIRGFCSVMGSFGFGPGHVGMVVRFKPAAESESSLRRWLLENLLPQLHSRPGIASAHLFEGAVRPSMTNEQRIRGAHAGVDWALFIRGYGQDAVAGLTQSDLGTGSLETRGVTGVVDAMYRMDYALTDREVGA